VCAVPSDTPQPGEPLITSSAGVHAVARRVLADHLGSLERDEPRGALGDLRRALLTALLEALASGDLTIAASLAAQLGALAQRQGIPLSSVAVNAHRSHTRAMDAIIGDIAHTDHAGLVTLLGISHALRDLAYAALAGYQDATLALLTEQALTDGLTGVANRRAFDTRLNDEIERGQRFGHGVALVFLDIDGLKRMNDTQGHTQGDALVCAVATLLRAQARGIDLVARVGGDEFAVILPETAGGGAVSLVQRLAQAAATRQVAGVPLRVSMGVAVYPDDGATPAALIAHADQHMYADKRRGDAEGRH